MHVNFWKCENKLDENGNHLGIMSSELNNTAGGW
jgi:hypothetical protein